MKKTLLVRERELSQISERLHLKEHECDKLEAEIRRLRNAESWKSTSPNSSANDLALSMGPVSFDGFSLMYLAIVRISPVKPDLTILIGLERGRGLGTIASVL